MIGNLKEGKIMIKKIPIIDVNGKRSVDEWKKWRKGKKIRTTEYFWFWFESVTAEFKKDMVYFAEQGDERDYIPDDISELIKIRKELKASVIDDKSKKELLKEIKNTIIIHEAIIDIAEEQQMQMQRHELGDYQDLIDRARRLRGND